MRANLTPGLPAAAPDGHIVRPFTEPTIVTKQQVAEAVARRLGIPKGRAVEIVDCLFGGDGVIAGELKKGGRVQIAGFGQFELRPRAGRKGRDPRTGKDITIAPSTIAAFRPGSVLKQLVSRSGTDRRERAATDGGRSAKR
ncbi:MAG TPA: HU family DNA-binding protein [Gemmatimonadales bacterium]|nr:HU family DNA-binding protein [Gemmatimonadales bacterium]